MTGQCANRPHRPWSPRRWWPLRITAVVIIDNGRQTLVSFGMKAVALLRTRLAFSETAFAELVIWKTPKPVAGSTHSFKYRLAYIVDGVCVIRYDNEAGKGDHRHFGPEESVYSFQTPEKLVADFERDMRRWNRENRRP